MCLSRRRRPGRISGVRPAGSGSGNFGDFADGAKAFFGFLVDVGGEGAFFGCGDVVLQVFGAHGSDDGGVTVGVGEGEPEEEGGS